MKDYSPAEYRIAIAEAINAPEFHDVVRESGSNSDSAIYFRKQQLQKLAQTLNIPSPETKTNNSLRVDIRKAIGVHNTTPTIKSTTSPKSQYLSTGQKGVADGGVKPEINTSDTDRSPKKAFTKTELRIISGILDIEPNPPYSEIELRKLKGSSIAGPYLAKLLEAAYLDVYISANVGSTTAPDGSRAYYPFRLQQVHEIPQKATNHPDCQKYIVDSSYKQDDYTNSDVLEVANRIGADSIILADVYQDIDGTIESVMEGIELVRQHEFTGEVIIPLQHPHDECYRHLRDRGISTDNTFAIGGLRDATDTEQVKAAEQVRAEAEDDIRLHGLGFGITEELASEIRRNPDLLDSLDYSTPVQTAIGDEAPGDKRLCSVAAAAGATLIEDIRNVSPLVDIEDKTRMSEFY